MPDQKISRPKCESSNCVLNRKAAETRSKFPPKPPPRNATTCSYELSWFPSSCGDSVADF